MSQPSLAEQRRSLELRLRQGRLTSPQSTAVETVKLLRRLVATEKFSSVEELLGLLQTETRALAAAAPRRVVVPNIGLRVLKTVREEWGRLRRGGAEAADAFDSLATMWTEEDAAAAPVDLKALRSAVIESLGELLTEVETARENMASLAEEQVEEGDVVVSLGESATLEAFFRAAGRARRFRLVLLRSEPAPHDGPTLADRLRASKDMAGVELREVGLAEALMEVSSASKVVVSASAVLGDGGLVGPAGAHSLALAAHHFAVPLIVPAGFYKLTPAFTWDAERLNPEIPPASLIPASKAHLWGRVEALGGTLELVPGSLVSLYVTHTSAYAPSYVYRLLNDQAHPKDVAALHAL